MTAVLANDLRVFAVQKWPTMNHKWRKNKLASVLRMSERRVKSIYEADPSARVRADEAERIKALIREKEQADDADRSLTQRLARVEAELTEVRALLALTKQHLERGTSVSQGAESSL